MEYYTYDEFCGPLEKVLDSITQFTERLMLFACWDFFLTLKTFSRPVLDEVHFSRLCCNPASPSEKHVTETRACKTLSRSKYFLGLKFPLVPFDRE